MCGNRCTTHSTLMFLFCFILYGKILFSLINLLTWNCDLVPVYFYTHFSLSHFRYFANENIRGIWTLTKKNQMKIEINRTIWTENICRSKSNKATENLKKKNGTKTVDVSSVFNKIFDIIYKIRLKEHFTVGIDCCRSR